MSEQEHSAQFDASKYPDHATFDHKVALQLFEDVASGGKLHLAAISDKNPVVVRCFQMPIERPDIVVFLRTTDEQKFNLYFCPNQSSAANVMPDDASITRLRAVVVDIDPMDTTSPEAWTQERLRVKQLAHTAIHHPHLKPSLVIDTGNGAQLVYLINPCDADDVTSTLLRSTMSALARRFGGDARTTHKTSGLFRIPGTCNHPGASKLKRGRHEAYGGIWHRDTAKPYDLQELHAVATEGQPQDPADKPEEEFGPSAVGLTLQQLLDQSRDLPDHLAYRVKAKAEYNNAFRDLMREIGNPKQSSDRSRDDYRLVIALLYDGFTSAEAAVCLGYYGASKAQPLFGNRWVRYVVRTVVHAASGTPYTWRSEDFWTEPDSNEAKPDDPPPKSAQIKRWFTTAELNARPFGGDRPLIHQLLPKRGLSMVYGESNSGKSLVALDICSCVASGVPFGGRPVDATGLVVYIAMEGGGGLHKRIKAMVLQHPERNLERLVCIIEPFSLHGDTADAKALVEILREIRTEHGGMHIDLLVIDMLAIAASGANENSAEDMSKVLDRISKIEQAFTCHVLTLHHTGKVAAKGARGWSGLRGRVDTELEISTEPVHRTGAIKITKQRDMEFDPRSRQGYMIRSVHLGDDGDQPVSGAVIELIEARYDNGLTEAEQEVMDALLAIGRPALAKEIADVLGKSVNICYFLLRSLIRKKQIVNTASKPQRYQPYGGFEEQDEDDGPVDPFS